MAQTVEQIDRVDGSGDALEASHELLAANLAQITVARKQQRGAATGTLSEEQKIHHIVRRLGYGATPDQIEYFRSIGPEATI
jgi:hypothetical protein